MNDVTQLLSALEQGDPHAASRLLPLVYDELRKLAAQRMAQEQSGQTLDAPALVHEAYRCLVRNNPGQPWNSRGHFFAAAAAQLAGWSRCRNRDDQGRWADRSDLRRQFIRIREPIRVKV